MKMRGGGETVVVDRWSTLALIQLIHVPARLAAFGASLAHDPTCSASGSSASTGTSCLFHLMQCTRRPTSVGAFFFVETLYVITAPSL